MATETICLAETEVKFPKMGISCFGLVESQEFETKTTNELLSTSTHLAILCVIQLYKCFLELSVF